MRNLVHEAAKDSPPPKKTPPSHIGRKEPPPKKRNNKKATKPRKNGQPPPAKKKKTKHRFGEEKNFRGPEPREAEARGGSRAQGSAGANRNIQSRLICGCVCVCFFSSCSSVSFLFSHGFPVSPPFLDSPPSLEVFWNYLWFSCSTKSSRAAPNRPSKRISESRGKLTDSVDHGEPLPSGRD